MFNFPKKTDFKYLHQKFTDSSQQYTFKKTKPVGNYYVYYIFDTKFATISFKPYSNLVLQELFLVFE